MMYFDQMVPGRVSLIESSPLLGGVVKARDQCIFLMNYFFP